MRRGPSKSPKLTVSLKVQVFAEHGGVDGLRHQIDAAYLCPSNIMEKKLVMVSRMILTMIMSTMMMMTTSILIVSPITFIFQSDPLTH